MIGRWRLLGGDLEHGADHRGDPGALLVGWGSRLANLPFKRQWPVRLALLLLWACRLHSPV